jgi:2-polyprenyl-3-methyl-5-hydroxy-6-metoxy-1,4-benzoquinol methylase
MSEHSLNLYGSALLDYFNGDTQHSLIAIDELGRKTEVPVKLFFREFDDFPEWEKRAVELCSGKVLDIGAGTGRHSLVLQERGLSVCAIDIIPECVDVMKRRGVRDAHCTDVLEFNRGPFETLMSVMNGLTMVETLEGLPAFLRGIRRLTSANGQYLVDSTDLRCSSDAALKTLLEKKIRAGRYFGELTARLEYKNRTGTLFRELFVDPETLRVVAVDAGWNCEVVMRQDNGRYLARLTPGGK